MFIHDDEYDSYEEPEVEMCSCCRQDATSLLPGGEPICEACLNNVWNDDQGYLRLPVREEEES